MCDRCLSAQSSWECGGGVFPRHRAKEGWCDPAIHAQLEISYTLDWPGQSVGPTASQRDKSFCSKAH